MVHRMIEDLYRARTPGSAALYARASRVLPAGLTHDSRATSPYPIYAARAAGARQSIVLSADAPAPAVDALHSHDDIAAVIIEPSGASWGQVPLPPGFLSALREATKTRRVPLIFDEVITGFRWSRGGAQARYGIKPDVTVLVNIMAVVFPSSAVGGP